MDELYPVKFDTDGLPFCRGCEKKLKFKSRRWCGEDCRREAHVICYPSSGRWYVEERDNGICAVCGVDTKKLEWVYNRLYYAERQAKGLDHWRYKEYHEHPKWKAELEKKYPWVKLRLLNKLSFWECDHTITVKDGGSNELSNLRTLCYGCHVKTFKKKDKIQTELKFEAV